MLSLAVAALAAAVLCWPAGAGRGRLTGLRRRRWRVPRGTTGPKWVKQRCLLLLLALAAGIGALLAGPGGGLAAAMMTGTANARWRAGRDHRAVATAAIGLSDALGVLVAELRAGAHPSDAAGAAVVESPDGPSSATRALSAAAAAARLGGDVPAALRCAGPVQLRSWLDRLAVAWSLADRYGIPLADLLDAVRSDTEQRVRFAAEVHARLAGPRATAAVLAGLPLLGLALGHAVGANPLRLLSDTSAGQGLLVVGTGLACAGVLWSARLMSRAVPA
ncbi:MAG TPA: type II secretion system F family protein [Pseudonocardiaceae bacterium]|nr:type II secretion system F family protein [Pseudonocardiaceae bacterium]